MKSGELICKLRLDERNTVAAINEQELHLIAHYIGDMWMNYSSIDQLYEGVGKISVQCKIHIPPAKTELLYFPKKRLRKRIRKIVEISG